MLARWLSRHRLLLAAQVLLVLASSGLLLFAQAPASRKWALLVGINEYEHADLKKLGYAVNDVTELGQVLRDAGYEVVLLTADEAAARKDATLAPTGANIRARLQRLVKEFRRGDTLLIGLSGHGVQFSGDEDGYFCPVDARPFKERTETLVSMKWIYDRLQKDAAAGVKLLLVDACRNDPKVKKGIDADTTPPPKGVGVLLSCSAGETSFERKAYRHGVFFHHVLAGLKGEATDRKGNVTWDSLRSYVKEQVAQDEKEQTPEESGQLAGTPPLLIGARKEGLGKEIRSDIGLKLVRIPGGTFKMGSPKGEAYRGDDEEQHEVEVSGFYLGEKEVTQGQFRAVMGYNPSHFSHKAKGGDGVEYKYGKPGEGKVPREEDTESYPVENVSWDEAKEFCDKLTVRDRGKNLPAGHVYRLPREAEWEYACRGGASSYQTFHFGNSLSSSQANFHGKFPYGGAGEVVYLERTCKVGSYKANGFGLLDMHGNVWEWCHDWYGADYYGKSPRKDPPGPASGSDRVIRGGGWFSNGLLCRSALRGRNEPANRYRDLGFRVAAVPQERK